MNEVIDEFLMLLIETGAFFHDDVDLHSLFVDVQRNVLSLRRQAKSNIQRYVIGLVGMNDFGKSTLLNSLLGGEFTCRGDNFCITAPVEFEYSDTLSVNEYFRPPRRSTAVECDSFEKIQEKLSLAVEKAVAEPGQVKRIVVQCPSDLLKKGIVLSNTPGFDSVQLEAATVSHEQPLKTYLHSSVSRVFWVVMADQEIDDTVKQFHGTFIADICNDLIVISNDNLTEIERDQLCKKYHSALQKSLLKVHFVSGRLGIQSRINNDEELYILSGIQALEQDFSQLGSYENRMIYLENSFVSLCNNFVFWIQEYEQTHQRPYNGWWRLDSFYRWKKSALGNPLKEKIDNILKQLQ